MMRIKVPKYAKQAAKKGLKKRKKLPKKKKFGLSEKEAKEKGIDSGVGRAKQLINNQYISKKDAKKIARFYQRWKNCRSQKCRGNFLLWGGRKFGRNLAKMFYD